MNEALVTRATIAFDSLLVGDNHQSDSGSPRSKNTWTLLVTHSSTSLLAGDHSFRTGWFVMAGLHSARAL